VVKFEIKCSCARVIFHNIHRLKEMLFCCFVVHPRMVGAVKTEDEEKLSENFNNSH
jgi:hypothetical protein